MKEFVGGLLLGALLGAGALYAIQTYVWVLPDDCDGLCGEGTVCEQGLCRIPAAESEAELEAEPGSQEGKGKRKGKRGRRGKRGGDPAAAEPGQGPPLDDDAHVPRFDPNKDQTIGMADGTGRLSDGQVDRELAKLDKDFQACVRDANARVDELGTGRVKLGFGVDGSGKVTGVNVSAPSNLKAAGIVPCVRKAVYGHKFPAFDGPEMKVSSSFSVE